MTSSLAKSFRCFLLLLALAASIGGIYLMTTAFADDAVPSSGTDAGTTLVESASTGDAGSTTQPTPTATYDSVLTPDTTDVPTAVPSSDTTSIPSSDSDAQIDPTYTASASDADDTVTPTPTVTEIPLTPEQLASGDLNGDSKVNIVDALSLFRLVNGQLTADDFGSDDTGNLKGDFNKDGRLNITDALKLFRFVNGQISAL